MRWRSVGMFRVKGRSAKRCDGRSSIALFGTTGCLYAELLILFGRGRRLLAAEICRAEFLLDGDL